MSLLLVGCNHRHTPLEVRERLAFDNGQQERALDELGRLFPRSETVLLSTCNRVELYMAQESLEETPRSARLAEFLAAFHNVPLDSFCDELVSLTDRQVVEHLFRVAASLDSMVVGEPQIIAQVKEAYRLAAQHGSTGPFTHALFQRALKVAKRVHSETALAQKRVSIPSVAVADFACDVFDRFDDKTVLVLGAGEMAEETLRYLHGEGSRSFLVVNRSPERAAELARKWDGLSLSMEELDEALVQADLVISTTGSREPLVDREHFAKVMQRRRQRMVFVLDLAVPRDFHPEVNELENVFLYSIDDLKEHCERNRRERAQEMERASHIVDQEADALMAELLHRSAAPVIQGLRRKWEDSKEVELERLFNQLPDLTLEERERILQFSNRLMNKLLHPAMTALRNESQSGAPHGLLESLKKLFHMHS